ncbi:VENN motif pre-toxin domain-containing protein, partial [Psychrobacter faecalis]|uniref:VENN motif pre-toxin domain-containing protein n=1 Tax=Psychrobacter faecalis TaxID=180588 RepID=UPI003FCF6C6A
DSQTSTTKAGVTGMAGQSDVTTATKDSLNEPLANSFDANQVNKELGAQTQITQAFDQERRKIKTELNQEEEKLRNAAKKALENGDRDSWEAYSQEADKIQQKSLIFDGISGALYGPNTNGAVGYVAKAISPQIAYQIGEAFKNNDFKNAMNEDNELAGVGSPQHILAHAILGAAVSAATGNDALIGGTSAAVGEGQALLLSKYLYDTKDPSELTAEQKDTISSIASLAGLAMGASTGEVTDAVNAGETALVAVQDNGLENVLLPHEIEEITNVWGTETRPITKKDFDKLVESMSATLGFDVEDAAIHIFRPLLDSPVGVAAGLTVKITSSGIKITSKSGKVTSYTAKELAQLNARRIASKNAASDIPSANIGSNLPVI